MNLAHVELLAHTRMKLRRSMGGRLRSGTMGFIYVTFDYVSYVHTYERVFSKLAFWVDVERD
jgi:hypothetical protein